MRLPMYNNTYYVIVTISDNFILILVVGSIAIYPHSVIKLDVQNRFRVV